MAKNIGIVFMVVLLAASGSVALEVKLTYRVRMKY